MNGLNHRTVRSPGAAHIRLMVAETLESRRLLSLVLSLNGGVLAATEDFSGAANDTTIQLIDDNTEIQINQNNNDEILGDNSVFNDGWTIDDNLDTATGPETGISSIVIDTFDGNDHLTISSMNLPVLIQPRGAASESIELGQTDSPDGAQDITAPITFDGTHAQSATLLVDDGMDSNDVDPTITSTSILDFAGAPINFTAPPQETSPMLIDCDTGTGTSGFVLQQDPNNPAQIDYQFDSNGTGTIGIEQLNAGSRALCEAQRGGTERAILGSDGLISSVKGTVDIEGDVGSASLVVNDSQDTTPHTFATTVPSDLVFEEDGVQIATVGQPITAFTLLTGPAANTVDLDAGIGVNFVATVQSNGPDNISVSNLLPSGTVDLIGAAAGDNISLPADQVQGTVNISNPTGLETVTIDGSNTNAVHVISASDSSVTGLGTGTFTLANLKSLSVIGGTAFDNFTVTPSTTVPITIDGGPTTGGAASTDRLDVNTTNATGTELSLQTNTTGQSGTFTFTNRQPVNFTRFGTITPSIGDLTGTVFNQPALAVIAGATVVVDENNNGVADPGEPTTTTDANGAYSFTALPTGTFGLLATATGLHNASAVSATISAGVDVVAADIPVVTTVTAPGGPDLVASVVATAPGGKGGSIKPRAQVKVSNIGTSMTSATSLKIILLASSDTVLDLTDQQLLTASTVPVLLKANKSKTFVLTGSTSTSLTKGSYFLLADVDADNDVTESNESNNLAVSTKSVLLAPAIADLTGKFGVLPKEASESKLLSVVLSIQNLGTIPAAGTIDFDFFASTDQTLDGSDVSLGTDFPVVAHLAAGKSKPARFKLSISSLPAGSYYLLAKINSTASISESDLTNNLIFSKTAIAIS